MTVGLTGYPNVGKSSTINALFGSKKTAVAPTPGKTKHFQTLNITDNLTPCDCPGLVLPRYAQSKSEMVAAGASPFPSLMSLYLSTCLVQKLISTATAFMGAADHVCLVVAVLSEFVLLHACVTAVLLTGVATVSFSAS